MPSGRRRSPQDKPLVALGPVAAPVARTGAQGITASFLVEGVEIWNLYHFTPAQLAWTVGVLTPVLAWALNMAERRAGRKVIGTPD